MAAVMRDAFRLHTGETGTVWFGRDNLPAADSGLEPDDFVGSMRNVLGGARAIRVIGCRRNARLIVNIKQHCQLDRSTTSGSLILVSPAAFASNTTEGILHRLWQPDMACRIACSYHDMRPGDFTSYLIADAIDEKAGPCEKARCALRYHPAWPAFSFIATLHDDAACRVIAHIIDPRWFRHHDHPHRLSRLTSYLGLTPANVTAYLSRATQAFRHGTRFADVVDCWFKRTTRTTNKSLPGNFLLRIVAAARNPEIGMLRACEKLLRFVCEVWLANLHSSYEFIPDMFFNDKSESDAFKQHAQQSSRAA